jgi:GNAT superfamily N-acetyltransferase
MALMTTRVGPSDIDVHVVTVDSPEARELERRHIAEMAMRYAGNGPARLEAEEFEPPRGCFVVAVLHHDAVACGGYRYLSQGVAEIKRMYVDPGARRRGIAAQVLALLEDRAKAAGYREAWLECGNEQPDAIAMYTKAGYEPRPPYGEFKDDPRSRCFFRTLPD